MNREQYGHPDLHCPYGDTRCPMISTLPWYIKLNEYETTKRERDGRGGRAELRLDVPPHSPPQQHDHIWLTVGGEGWAIRWIRWPIIGLWRGYAPNIEHAILDMSRFNTDSYVAKAAALLRGRA